MVEQVGLIIPPSPFLADERVFPSLGVLKVASSLERAGVSVDVLDLSGIKNYDEVVVDYMHLAKRARIIGISATTPQFPQAVKIRDVIKDNDPETRTVLGGAHATMVGSAFKVDQRRGVAHRGTQAYEQMIGLFDTIIVGDGEEAIFEAIGNAPPRVIDAGERTSPFFLQKGTLESYPFPNRDLIDFSSYHYEIDGKPAQSMIAQLGCPMECGFCGGRDTPSFRIARPRTPESVVEEVDILVGKYGKRGVMFYDDELNINNNTILSTMEALIRYQEQKDVDLSFRGFVKAELFTPEQAQLMYRAGFRVLLSGVESGDDQVLKTMKKHTTRLINSLWVKSCHDAGIQAKALMSVGHPGETEQSIANSLDWVVQNRPDDVDWSLITEYPGSPYFDHSAPHPTRDGVWVYTAPHTGQILYSRDVNFSTQAEYYKGVPGDYTSYVWTDTLSPQDLVSLRDKVEMASRSVLGLKPVQSIAAKQFEHSMAMGRNLPGYLLRSTND